MRAYELLLGNFLDHAGKWHAAAEVVTGAGAGRAAERIDYRSLRERAGRLSGAFAALGLKIGDRIATLAWNSAAHLECWYAAFGIGVSCHTLNPRLGIDQLAEMVRQAGDRILVASPDLADAVAQLVAACPVIERVVILDVAERAEGRRPNARAEHEREHERHRGTSQPAQHFAA